MIFNCEITIIFTVTYMHCRKGYGNINKFVLFERTFKMIINFLYNYYVSCLVFEINRLIFIKSNIQPSSWICIQYAYVTSRVKSKIFILQTTCHYRYETRFSEVFSTQLTRQILKTFRRNLVPHEEVSTSLPCL